MTTTTPARKTAHILMVEDNPGDTRLAREAFDEIDADVVLDVVNDGECALAFLRKENGYADVTTPQLIILDLNLPRKDGKQVLSEIKSDDALRQIPVIVLTTTDDVSAVTELYDRHANAFVTKPNTVTQFIDMIDSVQSFWLTSATLPPRRPDT